MSTQNNCHQCYNLSYLYFAQINSVSSLRLHMPKDLLSSEPRENAVKKIAEALLRYSRKGIPLLDPEDDMHVCYYCCYFSFFCSFLYIYRHFNFPPLIGTFTLFWCSADQK